MRRSILSLVLTLVLGVALFQGASAQGQSWTNGDFLIADTAGQRIAVFDTSLAFKGYLDTTIGDVWGLTLMTSGRLAAVSRNGGGPGIGRIRIYNSDGTVFQTIDDANVGNPVDLKASASDLLYSPQDSGTGGIARYNSTGFSGVFGSGAWFSGAVLPGNVFWAGNNTTTVSTFDLTTHTPTGTFTLDNGQARADTITYSPSTNTVLMTGGPGFDTIYERSLTGAFIRAFTTPVGNFVNFGVTRGPGNGVFATRGFGSQVVHRWTAGGTFVSTTDISATVMQPANIVWVPSGPTAAGVTVSGRVMIRDGRGVYKAIVTMQGQSGDARIARTNPFGYFTFKDIPAGHTYVVSVVHKSFQFQPRVIDLKDDLTDLIFSPAFPGIIQKKGTF